MIFVSTMELVPLDINGSVIRLSYDEATKAACGKIRWRTVVPAVGHFKGV